MTLTATKTTTGYLVEGHDAVQKPVEIFYDSYQSANYDHLVEAQMSFLKNKEFQARRVELSDPERDLYLSIFGKGKEHTDTALHSTLVEPQEARDGIAIDWSQDPVTAVLRLIDQGQSHRLRLINDQLVDMGPTPPAVLGGHSPAPTESPVAAAGVSGGSSEDAEPVGHGHADHGQFIG